MQALRESYVRRERAAPAITIPSEPARSVRPIRELYPALSEQRLRRGPIGGKRKRLLDIMTAAAALLVLAPLLAAIAILVRLESKGPALFRQRRGGYRGQTFLVLKFRTMRSEDDGKQVAQASEHDARVTKLGAFLRKTSLDELPQLFNVLAGDMSIVGPRPHAVAHDKQFAAIDPSYPRRGCARPGITGLAQVSGSRGPTQTPELVRERVRLDLSYVDHWSPLLDLWITIRTALIVLGDRKAF